MQKVVDFDTDLMCCGRRMVLMPNYPTHPDEVAGRGPVWTLGCKDCEIYTDHGPMDGPVFIINGLIEIGGN